MVQVPARKMAGKKILGSRARVGRVKFKGMPTLPVNSIRPSGMMLRAAWQSAMEGLMLLLSQQFSKADVKLVRRQ